MKIYKNIKSHSKHLGTIAEYAAIKQALERGFIVSIPAGDYAPYDLVFDNGSQLFRIQIKTASKNENGKYLINTRHGKNRRKYDEGDFDFALCYVENLNIFYIMPIQEFLEYKGNITIVEGVSKSGRKPKSWNRQNAWHLMMDNRK